MQWTDILSKMKVPVFRDVDVGRAYVKTALEKGVERIELFLYDYLTLLRISLPLKPLTSTVSHPYHA